jgi:hypothetical protein
MDPIQPEQVIQLADGETVSPLTLEALLHCLRRHGRVEIRVSNLSLLTDVPTACELSINTLKEAGASIMVSAPQMKMLNGVMANALV